MIERRLVKRLPSLPDRVQQAVNTLVSWLNDEKKSFCMIDDRGKVRTFVSGEKIPEKTPCR